MKYVEQLARRGGASRGYHSAFVTSFALDFSGFEELMLPQLVAAGATNVLLIVDDRMSALALSDGSVLPERLGRDYSLHGPRQERGVFHPKIVLQLGREGGRAFIGSANVTASGIGGNLELITEIVCSAAPSPERALIASIWDYVRAVSEDAGGAARDALGWAAEKTPWLRDSERESLVTIADGSRLGFFAQPGGRGIADRFADQIDEPVERLIALSPFWDDLSALTDMVDRFGNPPTMVLIEPRSHDFPLDAKRAAALHMVDVTAFHPGRFKHAKLLIAQTAHHDHVLTGSANVTFAALGKRGVAGHNAEASLYRRVAKGEAMRALALDELMGAPPLAIETLTPVARGAPLPLERAREQSPGLFEAEQKQLLWTPRGKSWDGRLLLLDRAAEPLGEIAIADMIESGGKLRTHVEKLGHVSFLRVDDGGAGSSLAPLFHRGQLRARRREAASASVLRAAERFSHHDDLELFLLQALDELEHADHAERPPTLRAVPQRRATEAPAIKEPRQLSYEEFVAQTPDARSALGGSNSLAGTQVDCVRELLNRLSNADGNEIDLQGEDVAGDHDDGDDGDHGDKDPPPQRAAKAEQPESRERTPIDRAAFTRAVRAYENALNGGADPKSVGGSDVLRLRFWLLLILHAAWRPDFRGGLPCSIDDNGWPRHLVRILAAFFFGKRAPIARLTMEGEHDSLPVDFLETWATALWALALIEQKLQSRRGIDEFLKPLPLLRRTMIARMGLTQAEMDGDVITGLLAGLDGGLGARLEVVHPPHPPRNRHDVA